MTFTQQSGLNSHKLRNHGDDKDKKRSKNKKDSKDSIACTHCGKYFPSNDIY